MQRWMAWMDELDAQDTSRIAASRSSRRQIVRGRKAVTDGPYTEAKDLVGGFTIVEAQDIDQAVELSHGCPILGGGGSVEVRPVMKMDF